MSWFTTLWGTSDFFLFLSLSVVALMWFARCFTYCSVSRLLWRRILHGNDSAHLSSTLPRCVGLRTCTHTHTHTPNFSLAQRRAASNKKKKASGVRSRPNSAGYILLETCCLYVSTIVVQRCNIFQRPYANTFRQASKNGLSRVKTEWRYFKASRGEKTNSSGHFKVGKKTPHPVTSVRQWRIYPLLTCTVSLDGGGVMSARLV